MHLTEAYMPFDFDFLLFFFVPITLLLVICPTPAKYWRITNERRMNEL